MSYLLVQIMKRREMMRKTRKHSLATDYFFESMYGKAKDLVMSNLPSKITALKVLAIVGWFKDIN